MILGAVSSIGTQGVGLLQRVDQAGVLLIVGDHVHDLVHLVPQLGGLQVVPGHVRRLAGCSGNVQVNYYDGRTISLGIDEVTGWYGL